MNINSPKSATTGVLQNTMAAQDKRMEQLASGKRVNSAVDDAAALQIIERMNAEATAYQRSVRNAFDGISLLQTAEGGMQQIQTDLQRIRELSVQAGSGILSQADRDAIGNEINALRDSIMGTVDTTTFAGQPLLNQQAERSFLVGSGRGGESQQMVVETLDLREAGLNGLATIDVSTASAAANTLEQLDDMLATIGSVRAQYGAQQSAFVSAVNSMTNADITIQSARSRIGDLDYAQATANRSRDDILAQSSIALRSQANVSSSQVLNLLG